jgi:hypothetical protein
MKKNILITENSLVTLTKSIMMENVGNLPNEFGCFKLNFGSEGKSWCDSSIKYISDNLPIIKRIILEVEKDLQKEEKKHLKNHLKFFDENDEFFSQNVKNLEILLEHTSYCEKTIEEIKKFQKKLPGKAIFVHKIAEKYQYSLLNKLNTNFSALAYLLTQYRLKNNLQDSSVQDVFKKYFQGGEFYNVLMNYFENKEYEIEIFKEVFNTITNTSRKGRETEMLAIKMLKNKFGEENVIDFAGDFSFVDMMGVDVLVYSSKMNKWVPVQIKSKMEHCKGNYRFCENICMTKNEKGVWIFKKYIGENYTEQF